VGGLPKTESGQMLKLILCISVQEKDRCLSFPLTPPIKNSKERRLIHMMRQGEVERTEAALLMGDLSHPQLLTFLYKIQKTVAIILCFCTNKIKQSL
jgi:hypothetical protein